MLHARADYAHIQDPSGKIPEGEPVFLIRGQDRAAPATLRFWANTVEDLGGQVEIIEMVRGWADQMENYQSNVASKVPDLPSVEPVEL